VGAVALAAALAALNNVVNPNRIPWLGRPRLLPSTPDLTDSHWKGALSGLRYGWHELRAHAALVGAGVVIVLGLSLLLRRLLRAEPAPLAQAWFRLGLAAMFAAASFYKLRDPSAFALTVAQYRLLPAQLVRPFALWLPAQELVVAAGLVLTRYSRELHLLASLLWVLFIVAVGQALVRRLGITCGCFEIAGAAATDEAWFTLERDVVLLLPSLLVAFRGTNRPLFRLLARTA
jgi:hypothetical protein